MMQVSHEQCRYANNVRSAGMQGFALDPMPEFLHTQDFLQPRRLFGPLLTR
jgi:hypothetical protein